MRPEGRGPGGKLGPPPCARGVAPGGSVEPEDLPGPPSPPAPEIAPEPLRDDPPGEDAVVFCDLCGSPMLERHCKLTCPRCGYQRDCSDP